MVETAPSLNYPGTFKSQITWEKFLIPELEEERVVILKRFLLSDSDRFLEVNLHTEASKASLGVVGIYPFILDRGTLTMRLEYCEQGSLLDVMRTRIETGAYYFLETDLIQMYQSMLTTISAVHAARIAHRNIECSNWLVTRDWKIKLTDFGSAKLIQDTSTVDNHSIRPEAANISRLLYEASLQDKGIEVDVFAEDIWALGKVFFELMTLKVYTNFRTLLDEELAQFIEQSRLELHYSQFIGTLITRMLTDAVRPKPRELIQLLEQEMTRFEAAA